MSELKTKPNRQKSVEKFLDALENEQRKKDAFTLLKILKKETGCNPVMWGDSIIGFGDYYYKYASGREGNWLVVGFSPRKAHLVFYSVPCFSEYKNLLEKLGKVKHGVSCVYIKKMEDIHVDVLKEIIQKSFEAIKK